jgi:hypothetical protein
MEKDMMAKETGCEVTLKLPAKGLTEQQVMDSLHK